MMLTITITALLEAEQASKQAKAEVFVCILDKMLIIAERSTELCSH